MPAPATKAARTSWARAGVPPSAAGRPGIAGRTRSVPAMPSTVPHRTSAKAVLGFIRSVLLTCAAPLDAGEAIKEEAGEHKASQHRPALPSGLDGGPDADSEPAGRK